MTSILFPVDTNHEESWRSALPEAVAQARAHRAALHVLAIVPDFGMTIVREYFPADFEREALEKALLDLKALCKDRIPDDVEWHAHIGHGDIDAEILRVAEELKVSLIVIASHPPSEMRSLLVGSHADRIVHRSPVSVLVVRGSRG